MDTQEIIKKVQDYLIESNTVFEKNSIEYIGTRENHVILNEDAKDYYFLSFGVVVDKSNVYSTVSYFVFLDKKTEKIKYILGPQSIQAID